MDNQWLVSDDDGKDTDIYGNINNYKKVIWVLGFFI